jgi:hypothetical protein
MSLTTYVVASRQGLYAVRRDGWRQLVTGHFFGIVCVGEELYAFRHGPSPQDDPNSGCIVHYAWRGGALVETGIAVEGLDHNCHQIDFFDGAFFIVDTFNQSILEYDAGWRPRARHQILPPAPRDSPEHAHINSIAGSADTVWVMLHNFQRGRSSEIVEFDRGFRERSRISLPCHGCHDILPLADGRLLTCLSPRGEIQAGSDEVHRIDGLWTRGLAAGPDEIAVGSSLFGKRMGRALLPGFVTFLDPAYQRVGRVYLPAAPTQIRRLPPRIAIDW